MSANFTLSCELLVHARSMHAKRPAQTQVEEICAVQLVRLVPPQMWTMAYEKLVSVLGFLPSFRSGHSQSLYNLFACSFSRVHRVSQGAAGVAHAHG